MRVVQALALMLVQEVEQILEQLEVMIVLLRIQEFLVEEMKTV